MLTDGHVFSVDAIAGDGEGRIIGEYSKDGDLVLLVGREERCSAEGVRNEVDFSRLPRKIEIVDD